jgi:chaperonin GroES
MNARPLHDRIIVQRLEEGEQKIGGIIIPDSAKEKPQQGKVISVGAGRQRRRQAHPARRQGGRSHPVREYSGQEIKLDGEISSCAKTKCWPSSKTKKK